MPFEFDPDKNDRNEPTHVVSLSAAGIFSDSLAVTGSDPDAEGEERYVTIGVNSEGVLSVVV